MAETEEYLTFFNSWKTRGQMEKQFGLSNTQSYRLIRWLKKGKFIEEKQLTIEKHQNRCWFYRRSPEEPASK